MIISTKEFRQYAKGIKALYQKGHPMSQSVYLDIKNKEARVINPFMYSIASFPFVVNEENEGEHIDNFFVSMTPFLAICDSYTELTLNSDREFVAPNGEKFTPASYDDDEYEIPKKYEDFSCEEVNPDDIAKLSIAVKFSGEEGTNGAILCNTVVATDKVSFYENVNLAGNYQDVYKFSPFAISFLQNIFIDDITVGKHEGYLLVTINKSFRFMFPESNGNVPPSYYSGEFMDGYKHENYVTVSRQSLIENLRFLSPFVSDVVNERISFKVDGDKFYLIAKEEHKAQKYVDIENSVLELNGVEVFISRQRIVDLVNVIKDDKLDIHLEAEKPVIYITGHEKTDVNTICVRLTND